MSFLTDKELTRFAAKTTWSGQCLLWTGFRNADGYGRVTVRNRQWGAHRLAYRETWGEIPDGMVVRHKCDMPACVNPAHLELGTHADNAKDRAIRKRSSVKLSEEQVRRIRQDKRKFREIAQDYKISPSAACLIRSGKRRQYVGG